MNDGPARRSVATLRFLPNDQWDTMTRGKPTLSQVEAGLSRRETQNERIEFGAIVAGFTRILEHMAASNDHFGYAGKYAQIGRAWRISLGQIQAWRLNFSDQTFSKRFETTADAMVSLLGAESKARFKSSIDLLKKDWEKNHPFLSALPAHG